ncbi:MAG: bifunctional riboflavin kinase/FAD synthetase [Myxococcota bacterium]
MSQQPIYRTLEQASSHLDSPIVTIGNFDGAHVGHQAIFRFAQDLANEHDTKHVALTFDPHPVRFFKPDASPFRLTPSQQRAELLLSYGLDAVVELEFDEQMSSLPPGEFVDQILVRGLDVRGVVVGEDFAFGKGRAGTTDDLVRLCDERDIVAHVCEHVETAGRSISSTRIREALSSGAMEDATRLLGRPYRVRGEVVEGDQRGRALGFPTANISTSNPVLPPNGVYATTLHVSGSTGLPSITNIGTRPTFGGGDVTVECFVLDHEGELDLYDKRVELDIWTFVREERQFDAPDGLIRQIQKDVAFVEDYFGLE